MVEVEYTALSEIARRMNRDSLTQIAIEIFKLDPIEVQNIYDEKNSVYQANYEILARWKSRDVPSVERFRDIFLNKAKTRKIYVPEVLQHVDLMGFHDTTLSGNILAAEMGGKNASDGSMLDFLDVHDQTQQPEAEDQNLPNLSNLILLTDLDNITVAGNNSAESSPEQLSLSRSTTNQSLEAPIMPQNCQASTASLASVADSTVGEEVQDPWQFMIEETDRTIVAEGYDAESQQELFLPEEGVDEISRSTSSDVENMSRKTITTDLKDDTDLNTTEPRGNVKQEEEGHCQFLIVPGRALVPYGADSESDSSEDREIDNIRSNVTKLSSFTPATGVGGMCQFVCGEATPSVAEPRNIGSRSVRSSSKNTPISSTVSYDKDYSSGPMPESSEEIKTTTSDSDKHVHRKGTVKKQKKGKVCHCAHKKKTKRRFFRKKCLDCKGYISIKDSKTSTSTSSSSEDREHTKETLPVQQKKDKICQCAQKKKKKCTKCPKTVSSEESVSSSSSSDNDQEDSIVDSIRSWFRGLRKPRRRSNEDHIEETYHQISETFQP